MTRIETKITPWTMATHVWMQPCLIFFFCSFFRVVAEPEQPKGSYQRREHSLMKPFQGSGMTIPQWDMLGNTMVTKSHVRLTANIQGQQGAIWNTARCISSSWEVHIEFKIHGATRTWFGDGMAFWYTKERMELGQVFGSADYFTGLGLFLDTYVNHDEPHDHQHPYISAMVNNGTVSYDHDKDGTHNQVAGCSRQMRNKDYKTYLAVRYEKNTLTVLTDIENKKAWEECFSVEGVKLPAGYFFGLSAATGDVTDHHDILSFKFYELKTDKDEIPYEGLPEAPLPKTREEKEEAEKKKKDEDFMWDIIVSVLIIVGTLCGFGVILFCILYQHRLDRKKKYY